MDCLTYESLELAGSAARDNNKNRIVPRNIQLALRTDEELSTLLAEVTIAAAQHPLLAAPQAGEKKEAFTLT
jgi:hypothetical protein